MFSPVEKGLPAWRVFNCITPLDKVIDDVLPLVLAALILKRKPSFCNMIIVGAMGRISQRHNSGGLSLTEWFCNNFSGVGDT